MARKTVKKKRGRPPVKKGDPGSNHAKILAGLTLYFSTGSYAAACKEMDISTSTLHSWIHGYPELCETAKGFALEHRLQRSVEAIDKIEFCILEILDSEEKRAKINFKDLVVAWGIHRDKYDRQMGIADKRELTGEVNINHKMFERYILLKEQAKKELSGDSNNRIKNLN